jgi:hypothetical protein
LIIHLAGITDHTKLKYNFRVVPNGVTSIPNSIQICPAVLKTNHVNRQTVTSATCIYFTHIMQRTYNDRFTKNIINISTTMHC